jgi:hypothetical protein
MVVAFALIRYAPHGGRGDYNSPMTVADDFRKQADEARQMAACSLKQEDKAFWLRLAEDWIKLAGQTDDNTKRQR